MNIYDIPPRTCEECGAEFTRRRGEKPATFTARKRCDRCAQVENKFELAHTARAN